MNNQITIGELISLLEKRPADHWVCFDFGGFEPTSIDSYRGFYNQPALGFTGAMNYADETGADRLTVGELLTRLREAVGHVYEGWKGGDFMMREYSPLWVANPGRSTGTAIIGLAECDFQTVIATAYLD